MSKKRKLLHWSAGYELYFPTVPILMPHVAFCSFPSSSCLALSMTPPHPQLTPVRRRRVGSRWPLALMGDFKGVRKEGIRQHATHDTHTHTQHPVSPSQRPSSPTLSVYFAHGHSQAGMQKSPQAISNHRLASPDL